MTETKVLLVLLLLAGVIVTFLLGYASRLSRQILKRKDASRSAMPTSQEWARNLMRR